MYRSRRTEAGTEVGVQRCTEASVQRQVYSGRCTEADVQRQLSRHHVKVLPAPNQVCINYYLVCRTTFKMVNHVANRLVLVFSILIRVSRW